MKNKLKEVLDASKFEWYDWKFLLDNSAADDVKNMCINELLATMIQLRPDSGSYLSSWTAKIISYSEPASWFFSVTWPMMDVV